MQRKLCIGKCHIQFLRSKVHYVCVGNRMEDNTSHFKHGKNSRSVKDKDRSKDLILNH